LVKANTFVLFFTKGIMLLSNLPGIRGFAGTMALTLKGNVVYCFILEIQNNLFGKTKIYTNF